MRSIEDYEGLVRRLEAEAKARPETYKRKVVRLTMLGYGYLYFMLLLGLAAAGLLAFVFVYSHTLHALLAKLIYLAAIVLYLIIRSLWFKIEPPDGLEIAEAEYPRLFGLIHEVNRKLNGPKIHHVLIDDDYNAAIMQWPKFGWFGFHRNYLLIGLPMLLALSETELKAVIAHEIGHLAGEDGRMGAFVYRTRESMARLMTRLEEERRGWATFLFAAFYRRYIPYFLAYTFVWQRQQEYMADRKSAQVVGCKAAAAALLNGAVKGRYLQEKFWTPLFSDDSLSPEVPDNVFASMRKALMTPPDPEEAAAWKREALEEETGLLDTHPSRKDRIRSLGVEAGQLEAAYEPGVSESRGNEPEKLVQALSRIWAENVREYWSSMHEEKRNALEEYSRLKEQGDRLEKADEIVTLAKLTERFDTPEAALALFRKACDKQPDHAGALFHAGRILLGQEDESGVGFVERAYRTDRDATVPGCELIIEYYRKRGMDSAAEPYREMLEKHYAFVERVEEEKSEITTDDDYRSHELPEEEVENLRKQLETFEEVRQAFLVRKEIAADKDAQVYVLGFTFKRPWHVENEDKFDQGLSDRIANKLVFPHEIYVFPLNLENRLFKKLLGSIPQSLVYERKK
ncbi:M48 family metalloprotease [Cohnella sp. CFH 77786]|uniref:M48 family metallopeptidase n=1 Tax=Cohnella sp. CFH 77786 TaxID=2662265 RepID=UPI001C609DF4|nr:M48 family metallopeptidase [Cohnella sp. CFH 77786]MBW5448592.1 M48 family metalloprotease [Cohnella sp. CFH 77786]